MNLSIFSMTFTCFLTASRHLSMLSNKFSNSSVSLSKSFKTLWKCELRIPRFIQFSSSTSGSPHNPWECFQCFLQGWDQESGSAILTLWRNQSQSRQACLELHWPSILDILRFHKISSANECDFLLVRLFHIPMHLIPLCSEFYREYFAIQWF